MLGPSGAGKTTTLKSVAGLVDIDDGEVKIGGRTMTQRRALPPQRRHGVRELRALPAEDGVREPGVTAEVGPHGHLLGAGPEAADRPGHHHARHQPRCCSASRASCPTGSASASRSAGCWSAPADVYLLDEPLSPPGRQAARGDARRAQAARRDVEHHLPVRDARLPGGAGARRPDRGAAPGQVVQVGTPEQIWREPHDTFVAQGAGAARDQPDRRGGRRGSDPPGGRRHRASDVPRDVDLGRGDRVRLGIRPRDLELVTADEPQRRRVAPRRAAPSPSPNGWAATSSSPCTSATPR